MFKRFYLNVEFISFAILINPATQHPMTYKARLEELLSYSILKSNAYIDIVSKEGQSNSSRCIKAQAEWEVAENAYIDFLLKFEGSGASINDQLPASMIIPGGAYQNMIGN